MRTFILLTLGLSIQSICETFAQPDPITIEFVEAQPIWEHLVWDTTFYEIGNQPDVNKYTVVKPHQSYRFGDDLFVSSICTNHRGEFYGYILERLNILTGEIIWQNYSTYYNSGLQDHYKNLFLREDGLLEMTGIKRHGPYPDSLFFYWNQGGGKSNFVRKLFDYQNGGLLQTIIGKDSVGNIIPTYLNHYPIIFDSTYIVCHLTGNEVNDTVLYGYDFYLLNHQHDKIDSLPVSTILYETNDEVDFWSYGQPQFIKKLNDTTFICLIFQDRFYPEKTRAQLIWINIIDPYDIKVTKRKNIEDLIPGNETSYLYFNFQVSDHSIYIYQPYYDSQILGHTSFLLSFDHNGNLLHSIPQCKDEMHYYESINLIYAGIAYDYFVGFPSKTGRKGFDVLKLDHGTDSFKFISSLTSAFEDEEFTRGMEVSQLYEDDILIIGAVTRKLGPERNSAVKYYAFDGKDLGLDLTSPTKVLKNESRVFAYPNPTHGVLNFNFGRPFTGKIILFDIVGKFIGEYQVVNDTIFKMDITKQSNGIIFAKIIDNQMHKIDQIKIILTQ